MHIFVYNDATVSTHKLMTRPKFVNMYDAAKTSRKVGKTVMIYTMFLMTIFSNNIFKSYLKGI